VLVTYDNLENILAGNYLCLSQGIAPEIYLRPQKNMLELEYQPDAA
jgi:hypothetical protein